jgi:hypothetical protein
MTDLRIGFGVMCTWWGPLSEVLPAEGRFLRCPVCQKPLYEFESAEKFLDFAARYEAHGHKNQVALVKYARGRCFSNWPAAQRSFEKEDARRPAEVSHGGVS